MLIRAMILAMTFSASALPAQTTTYRVPEYLPLEVGNSWTYWHSYSEGRFTVAEYGFEELVERPPMSAWDMSETHEFTVSILRTEVLDGHTWYVFSDMPDNWPPAPTYFLAGKKVRWDGNNLMEHDGTSEFSVYRFHITSKVAEGDELQHSIPSGTYGDDLLTARCYVYPPTLVPTLSMDFTGFDYVQSARMAGIYHENHWDAVRQADFLGGFGIMSASDIIADGDDWFFQNEVGATRVVLKRRPTSTGSQDRTGSGSETVTYADMTFNEYFGAVVGDGELPSRTTSASSSSWGNVKEGADR